MDAEGIIIRSSGGFYYVETGSGDVIECRARGKFRRLNMSPLVGDRVTCELLPDLKGAVTHVHPRKNFFNRPPVANVDRFIIVASASAPEPNLYIIDKMTVLARLRGVEPFVIFTKSDLADTDRFTGIYEKAGICSFGVSAVTGENIDRFRGLISDGYSVLTGNTGVGKSTLLNACDPSLGLATGEISEALGRGRHTTRTVEMFRILGGRATDTPGFSSLDGRGGEVVRKELLPGLFPEFEPYTADCRFPDCAHINDRGCAVRDAAERGDIPAERYNSYRQMYEEVKDLPAWKQEDPYAAQ